MNQPVYIALACKPRHDNDDYDNEKYMRMLRYGPVIILLIGEGDRRLSVTSDG